MSEVQLELSEDGIDTVFQRLASRTSVSVEPTDWVKIGPLRIRLARGEGHIENGKFQVIDPAIGGPIGQFREVDFVWDRLDIGIGLNIRPVSVGGFCIIPNPFGGCILRAPRKTFFAPDPDVSGTLPLAGLRHEITSSFLFDPKDLGDRWVVRLKPQMPIDVDFIDAADMVGDLLDRLVDILVDDLLSFLPVWARSLVRAILGGFVDLIRGLLDLADDVMEWIE